MYSWSLVRIVKVATLSVFLTLIGCPEPVLPQGQGVLWLRFAQISDTHILDDESPARTVRLADLFYESWRPQDSYTMQVLDATLRMLNDYHTGALQPQRRLDFVIHTGDTIDNAQYNELQWFMDIMEGRTVLPDSGALDGPDRPVAPEDNPKLAFQATGLLPEIPWYVLYGNHDALCAGNFVIDHEANDPVDWTSPLLGIVAGVVGLHQIDRDLDWLSPTIDASPAIILGNMDVADPDTLKLQWDRLTAGPIPADPRRQFISKDRFVQTMLDSPSQPPGHGFSPAGRWSSSLCYSVRPKEDVPIRLIALDTARPAPREGFPAAFGVLMRDQFDQFLKPAVEAARKAGESVLLATHHPSGDFDIPYPGRTVGSGEFHRYLASQTNIIAHICGHTHRNRLQVVNGPHPYPEIETGSLIDYPQEVRIIEIYYIEETHSFRVQSTMASHMAAPTRLSAESYRRASISAGHIPDSEAFTKRYALQPEDLFPLDPPGIVTIQQRGRAIDRDFSITLK